MLKAAGIFEVLLDHRCCSTEGIPIYLLLVKAHVMPLARDSDE